MLCKKVWECRGAKSESAFAGAPLPSGVSGALFPLAGFLPGQRTGPSLAAVIDGVEPAYFRPALAQSAAYCPEHNCCTVYSPPAITVC